MTHEQYLSDKALLDDLNQRIDLAPSTAKPVFRGIVELHTRVKQQCKVEAAQEIIDRIRRAGPQRS